MPMTFYHVFSKDHNVDKDVENNDIAYKKRKKDCMTEKRQNKLISFCSKQRSERVFD